MIDDHETIDEQTNATSVRFWDRHRISLLLVIAIVIAIGLTAVSLTIYNTSGTLQLDQSRPGYTPSSDQAERQDEFTPFSSSGPVDKTVIGQYLEQYDKQAASAKAVDAFNGDPLNPEVLEFGVPASE